MSTPSCSRLCPSCDHLSNHMCTGIHSPVHARLCAFHDGGWRPGEMLHWSYRGSMTIACFKYIQHHNPSQPTNLPYLILHCSHPYHLYDHCCLLPENRTLRVYERIRACVYVRSTWVRKVYLSPAETELTDHAFAAVVLDILDPPPPAHEARIPLMAMRPNASLFSTREGQR